MHRAETDTDPDLILPVDPPVDEASVPEPSDSFAITFRPPPSTVTIYAQMPRLRVPRATRPPTDERD